MNETNHQIDADFSLFAIVRADGKEYLGLVVEPGSRTEVDAAMAARAPIQLEPAFELVTQDALVGGPNGQPGLARIGPTLYAFGITTEPAPLHVVPSAVMFLEEMSEADERRYLDLFQGGEELLVKRRASALGLVSATELPKGRVAS